MEFDAVRDGTPPLHACQRGLVNVEAQGRLLRILRGEFDAGSVYDELIDNQLRVLRIEGQITAERGDENASAIGDDSRNVSGENAAVTAFNRELLNRDELSLLIAVAEFDAVEDASGRREICRFIAANGNFAVAGFRKILNDGLP